MYVVHSWKKLGFRIAEKDRQLAPVFLVGVASSLVCERSRVAMPRLQLSTNPLDQLWLLQLHLSRPIFDVFQP